MKNGVKFKAIKDNIIITSNNLNNIKNDEIRVKGKNNQMSQETDIYSEEINNSLSTKNINNIEDIDNYIKCVNNTKKIWFKLEHDLINSKPKWKNAKLMKNVGKYEEKIGAKVIRKKGLIERMLEKIKIVKKDSNIDLLEREIVINIKETKNDNNIEENNIKKKGIIKKAKGVIDNKLREITEESREKKAKNELIRKQKEEQKRIKIEEKRKIEEKKKAELAKFNKRYNDYDVLARGILGKPAKKNMQDIKNDVVHNDIYNMTSSDDITKGIATYRVGHRLATLSTKKKEAERLLKVAITILNNDDILSKDNSLIDFLQDAYMDLGNLYLMNNNFVDAEKSFENYMETVKKEKIEKYDPKILEAKKNGKVIDEIDLWMKIKSKFVAGKKSMIKLLSKSGKKEDAEKLYKKLLDDCRISLNDAEYQLSVDSNCIENGRYMRITKEKTYSEPILGNEYLLLQRKRISDKAIVERE